MNKLLQYHIQVNANLGATLRKLGFQWLSWAETQPAPKLSAHIQYDIGLDDCRPLPRTIESIQREEASQLEAMRQRLI